MTIPGMINPGEAKLDPRKVGETIANVEREIKRNEGNSNPNFSKESMTDPRVRGAESSYDIIMSEN